MNQSSFWPKKEPRTKKTSRGILNSVKEILKQSISEKIFEKVHMTWAKQLERLAYCSNLSFFDFENIAVIIFRLFIFKILDEEYMFTFFEVFFSRIIAEKTPIDHPIVAFLLLHGKLFDKQLEWYKLIMEIQQQLVLGQNIQSNEDSTKRKLELYFQLVGEFAAQYENLIDSSWSLVNSKIQTNASNRKFGHLRFRVGRTIQKYMTQALKIGLQIYWEDEFGDTAKTVSGIQKLLTENEFDFAANLIATVKGFVKEVKKGLTQITNRYVLNYSLLNEVKTKLEKNEIVVNEEKLLRFVEKIMQVKLKQNENKDCLDFYTEYAASKLFQSLISTGKKIIL